MSSLMTQARSRVPRFAEAAVERARLSVVPRRRTAAPRTPFVMLVVLLLAGGVAGLLAFNTSMQQRAFTVTALQTKADSMAAHQQSLQMDLQRLRDPQQLAERAKKLGMVAPPQVAFVDLQQRQILGQPLAATPDNGMQIDPDPAKKPKILDPAPRIVEVPAEKTKNRSGGDVSSTDRQSGAGTNGSQSTSTQESAR